MPHWTFLTAAFVFKTRFGDIAHHFVFYVDFNFLNIQMSPLILFNSVENGIHYSLLFYSCILFILVFFYFTFTICSLVHTRHVIFCGAHVRWSLLERSSQELRFKKFTRVVVVLPFYTENWHFLHGARWGTRYTTQIAD
jgi:hypothetical protein